jgi:DNA-binding transcriptional regulator YdaS (Cro superfamily)
MQAPETAADDMRALEEAVKAAGGYGALAEKIGVAASAPSMWRKRGSVPAEHCPAIERETGVACERLNAKADWAVLRATDAAPTTQQD